MQAPKRIKRVMGVALTIAAAALSFNAFSEPLVQLAPEAHIVAKEAGIFNAIAVGEPIKSISVPSEGAYTCKEGKAAVDISDLGRIALGSVGGSFLVTMNSGRKVIVFAPTETAFKAALALAIESQLAGLPVTFRNNSSETQDAFFKGTCDADKTSIINEITISK